jgi:hypothetical protein
MSENARKMMSRTRTATRTMSADELIASALRWDERARVARLAAYVADRDGNAEKAHAATLEWCNAAHHVRTLARKGSIALRAEGRNGNELIEVLTHARACHAEGTNPAGPPL